MNVSISANGRIVEITLPRDTVIVSAPSDEPKVIHLSNVQAGILYRALKVFEFGGVKTVSVTAEGIKS